MSLIHEQIYQSETLADLDFGEYIGLLSGRLFSTYCVDPARVRIELNVEPVHLNMNRAIPCGLILNELISNSLKHGFPEGHSGVFRIALRTNEEGRTELEVSDSGVEFPADFRWEASRSPGLQVVRALTRQLRAALEVTAEGSGATFWLSWDATEVESGAETAVAATAP